MDTARIAELQQRLFDMHKKLADRVPEIEAALRRLKIDVPLTGHEPGRRLRWREHNGEWRLLVVTNEGFVPLAEVSYQLRAYLIERELAALLGSTEVAYEWEIERCERAIEIARELIAAIGEHTR